MHASFLAHFPVRRAFSGSTVIELNGRSNDTTKKRSLAKTSVQLVRKWDFLYVYVVY